MRLLQLLATSTHLAKNAQVQLTVFTETSQIGSRWLNVGEEKPTAGAEITCVELQGVLKAHAPDAFISVEDLPTFQVQDMSGEPTAIKIDSFIKIYSDVALQEQPAESTLSKKEMPGSGVYFQQVAHQTPSVEATLDLMYSQERHSTREVWRALRDDPNSAIFRPLGNGEFEWRHFCIEEALFLAATDLLSTEQAEKRPEMTAFLDGLHQMHRISCDWMR